VAPVEATAVDAQQAEDLELFQQLAELGSGATIQVYREPGRDFLDAIPPEAVEVENLKALFGGGSYSLRARRDGTWIKGISMVRVRIAGAPKPGSPGQPLPGELTPTPLATVHPPGTVEARLVDIEALLRNRENGGSGATAMVTMMSTLLVPVLTTALQRQPENSAVEILELARKLAKDQREAANLGRADESDPIRDLGLPLLEVITKGLPAATPAPTPAPPALNPGAPGNDTAEALTPVQIAARIAKWCEPYERRDSDPALRAECFLDDMRDSPLLGPCLDLIELPDVLDLWAVAAPRVAEKREWYASFVDELRRLTAGDAQDPDTDDTARDPGHEVHAPDDGEAGAAREQDAGDSGASS
jgi:hypothetical protein